MSTVIQITNFVINFIVYMLLPYLFLGILSVVLEFSYYEVIKSSSFATIMYVYAVLVVIALGEGSENTKPYLFKIKTYQKI